MNEELMKVGSLLRAKRKEINMTLKEIESATSIRAGYLDAIEEGKIGEFISGIYALGFIKQYAQFLGFDVDKLIKENPTAFKMPQEKHAFAYGIGTLEVRGGLGGGVKWLPSLLWSIVATLVLLLAWYFAKLVGIL